MDMTEGSLLTKVLFFSLPIMLSGILQLLFNAADTIVVGRFAGNEALAAVGSVGSLNNMIISLFVGLSIGVNVLVARFTGAKDAERVSETVHTAVLLSIVGGAVLAVVGFVAARPLLEIMGSPEDVIDLAELYIRIIFIGMPVQMLYNFCAAVLRAVGDTKRPLYFLTIAGVINAGLNLVFVIGFKMSVAGVALATIISQAVSAALVTRSLMLMDGPTQLHLNRLSIKPHIMRMIIQIGLPAGIQSCMFSLSNVVIQSSVNSFGSIVIAGNAAGANVGNFVYQAMNTFQQAVTCFAGQNIGARKPRRVLTSMYAILHLHNQVAGYIGNHANHLSLNKAEVFQVRAHLVAAPDADDRAAFADTHHSKRHIHPPFHLAYPFVCIHKLAFSNGNILASANVFVNALTQEKKAKFFLRWLSVFLNYGIMGSV